MTHHPDPHQIAAALAQDRVKLSATLGALRSRLSVNALADDAIGLMQAKAGRATGVVDHAVRTNPLALGVVGAGLAWLAFGKGKPADVPTAKLAAMSNWEDDGGPARPSDDVTPVGQQGYAPNARATSTTGRMIEDHPLLIGTLLLGVGAALGAALPRTQTEDSAFGPDRNRLLDHAAAHLAKAALRA
jgi:hypothetical protein